MTKLFKCNKCGKEFSYDSPALEKWAETKAKPEQVKCPECFAGAKSRATNTNTPPKSTPAKTYSPKGVTNNPSSHSTDGKKEMSARLLKQKYDELCAVFGDDLDSVKDYLGGWTTTLVLSEVNNKK